MKIDKINDEFIVDCTNNSKEEIQQAQKTIVKMYFSNKGEFEIEVVAGKAYYKPENKELPKEWI